MFWQRWCLEPPRHHRSSANHWVWHFRWTNVLTEMAQEWPIEAVEPVWLYIYIFRFVLHCFVFGTNFATDMYVNDLLGLIVWHELLLFLEAKFFVRWRVSSFIASVIHFHKMQYIHFTGFLVSFNLGLCAVDCWFKLRTHKLTNNC